MADVKGGHVNEYSEDHGQGLGPDHDPEAHTVEVPKVENKPKSRAELLDWLADITAELYKLSRDLNHVGEPNAADAAKRAYREIATVVNRGEITIEGRWLSDV